MKRRRWEVIERVRGESELKAGKFHGTRKMREIIFVRVANRDSDHSGKIESSPWRSYEHYYDFSGCIP